ncbi:IclR family transcriptional regulator [Devosia sp. A449]
MTVTEIDSQTEPARRTRTSGIDRALQIFDYLQQVEQASTAYEIARAVGAPLSTIYAIIDDLVAKDLLDRDSNGQIWLGPRLYHYGLSYARSLDLLSAATQEMHELARQSGETVQICGRDQDMMVVLAMEDGSGQFNVSSRIGTRSPLNWTASGRLLVGHLPQDELLTIFARSARVSPTGQAETDPQVLADNAHEALAQGLSIQAGESDFAVACIAAPILDRAGRCHATMSIVVPEHKVQQKDPDLITLVRASAHRVESRLGWLRQR